MLNFSIDNRQKISDKLKDNSVLVLFSGKSPVKAGDLNYYFSPNRNFFYMTGLAEQELIFVLTKINSDVNCYLYNKHPDEIEAKWVGESIQKEECTKISGIENVKFQDKFKKDFAKIIFENYISTLYLDIENRDFNSYSESILFADLVRNRYPYVNILNAYKIFSDLRIIKEDAEIENIKKAINITKSGFYSMMRNIKPEMYEYEVEAYFDFELKRNGVFENAFDTIAASGANATILHYSKNNSLISNNSLILIDAGAKYLNYSADITRTFPANGKFTDRQKQLYNIVLKGQQLVIDAIKPNIPFSSLNEILVAFYGKELKNIGLIDDKSEVSKYYYHGVSHLLGLETHDVGRHNEGDLRQGMVLTVEPGLYIEDERIGIRIEDNVLVTDSGCEVLSKEIIKTVEEIELFMQNRDK